MILIHLGFDQMSAGVIVEIVTLVVGVVHEDADRHEREEGAPPCSELFLAFHD